MFYQIHELLPVCFVILKIMQHQNLYPFFTIFAFEVTKNWHYFFLSPFHLMRSVQVTGTGYISILDSFIKGMVFVLWKRESCSCHATCSVYKDILNIAHEDICLLEISLRIILDCGVGQVLVEKLLWSIRYLRLKWLFFVDRAV